MSGTDRGIGDTRVNLSHSLPVSTLEFIGGARKVKEIICGKT